MTRMYTPRLTGDDKYDARYWQIFASLKPCWHEIRDACRVWNRHYGMTADLGAALREGALPEAKQIMDEWDHRHGSWPHANNYYATFLQRIEKLKGAMPAEPGMTKLAEKASAHTDNMKDATNEFAALTKKAEALTETAETPGDAADPTRYIGSVLREKLQKANDRISVITKERDDARAAMEKLHGKYDESVRERDKLSRQCIYLEAELARRKEQKKPDAIKPELNLKEVAELKQLREWVANTKFTQQGVDKWREQAYFYGTTLKYLTKLVADEHTWSIRQMTDSRKLTHRIKSYYDLDYYKALVNGDAYIGERMRKWSRAWD